MEININDVEYTEYSDVMVIPSKGNFVCVNFEKPAIEIYQNLLKAGVIVRPIFDYDMPNHLRITIGLERENTKFIKELEKIMAK